MTFVAELSPPAVWRHFDAILTIPRASKNEAQIRAVVVEVTDQLGLSHDVDAAGNIVVRKPATPGHENAPVTILQAHLDMVNEKNSDVDHDFTKDPIRPRLDGEYLKATGTTLGSDNGIGVAMMLAVMESSELTHGPLEFLFTVDEESGLTGAAQLDGSMLEGTSLLNLDSEEEGIVYVGCAGGGDSTLRIPVAEAPVAGAAVVLRLGLSGLRGGHSGADIHLQRGNAISLLARALWAAVQTVPVRLAEISGGSAHNAIPREAGATVVVPREHRQPFEDAVRAEFEAIRAEYTPADPNIALNVTEGSAGTAWTEVVSNTILRLLTGLPHGVLAMNYAIPDLVETSTNLATVGIADGGLAIKLSSRSSVDTALEAVRRRIRALGLLAGAEVEEDEAYPGWSPNLESALLGVVQQVHERTFGTKPDVKAIHAGLECGIIGKKKPGLDMVSFGPQIEFPHSPDERVHIASVERFYTWLTAVLEALT
jgi:dipeptidase D